VARKINLHQKGGEFEPKADKLTPGSEDLCFLTQQPIAALRGHLESIDATVIKGAIERTGATGPIRLIYFRDPDGNLIEVANLF
jgi:catechol 2,3-dioxygenase-like lactoylglutathione lyase family enzyme